MITHYKCGAIDTPFVALNDSEMVCPCLIEKTGETK
jgi:hypothetical protein